ncbi:MAG: Lrp/AsnC family transcriptional regulator [Candidatus Adiutrix sp.]|nr:Lrp/AsnC family transcriptional regulator [Candidatus Adiutrix sp.]
MNGVEKKIVFLLSGDLGYSFTPYADLAAQLGLDENKLLEIIKTLQTQGIIRRLGVILRHQKSGYTANAMAVYQVEAKRIQECGEQLAELEYVSHCYQRRAFPGWPFNLYAMIHAESKDQLLDRAKEATAICRPEDWRLLESITEFKKASLRYFSEA